MRRRAVQVFLLLSCLLLTACSQMSIATPPRRSPGTPSPSLSPATSSELPTAPLSVYIGAPDGTVSALSAANGAVRWRSLMANARTTTVAALAEGVVYVSATDARMPTPNNTLLSALRASDGSILWHKTLARTGAVVATSQGVVYLALGGDGSTPNEIQMLRAHDGAVLWHTQVAGTGPLHASAYQGTIYVTSFTTLLPSPGYYYASTVVYALNASTGAVYWHSSLARTNYLAAVTNSAVYLLDTGTDVVCDPHVLHVLSARDGTEHWQLAGTFLEVLGMEQEQAYVEEVPDGCVAPRPFQHGMLSALHTTDGSRLWQSTIPFGAGAMASNGTLYVPSEDGDLAAYSASTGVRLWHAQGEGGGLDLFDGVLYTSLEGRGLDALSSTTGAVEWRYPTHDAVAGLGVAHGLLYGVVSHINSQSGEHDHALVALSAGTGELLWRVAIGMMEGTPLVG